MKTKKIYLLGAVLVAALTTFAFQNHKSSNSSDLALENIEAISREEIPGDKERDKYCEPLPNQRCTLVWKIGDGEENTTIFLGYWPKYDSI